MIRNMKEKGMSNREIARDLGISRNTVSKLLRTTKQTDHRHGRIPLSWYRFLQLLEKIRTYQQRQLQE